MRRRMYGPAAIVFVLILAAAPLAGDAPSGVAASVEKLRAELQEGKVKDWTLRKVALSRDPLAVDVLLEILASPESLRYKGMADPVFEYAAKGLGLIQDSGAIPALQRFLASRLGADTLPPDAMPFGESGSPGWKVNLERTSEALEASLALYALGDWRTSLPAFEALVSNESTAPSHHLWRAAELSTELYASDAEAMDSIAAYLKRSCNSPFPDVQAGAALSLATLDPDYSFETASRLLATGPDESPRSPNFLAHPKRVAINALVANPSARAEQLLQGLLSSGRSLVQAEAKAALARAGRGEE